MEIESIRRELRFAARQLVRSPGYSLIVVMTLALAVGANTATFSVVNSLLIGSLPYEEPERIATVFAGAQNQALVRRSIDGEQWEALRDNAPSLLSAVSAFRARLANFQSDSYSQQVREGRVSSRYLDVLGISPVLGRSISDEEDRPDASNVAVLSHALWRSAFGADPGALGRTVRLKGEPYVVIGVLPDRTSTPLRADVYTALRPSRDGEGQFANYVTLVRLRDGATWVEAEAQINGLWEGSTRARQFAEENAGRRIQYHLVPLQTAQTSQLRPQILALMLAACIILLIACANLAGLALVRVQRRASEIATRCALGATSWQVQRQLWTESVLLALLGGTIAVILGRTVLRLMLELLPPDLLPVTDISLDGRVLAFTLLLSLVTTILFGALPALALRGTGLRAFHGRRSSAMRSHVRLRQGLIAGEVALTIVLLAASGLLIRSLVYLQTLPPGFDFEAVTVAKALLNDQRYQDPATFRDLLSRSLDAIREIPGVEDAAVASTPPYERAVINGVTLADGPRAGEAISANWIYITPTFFSTLGVPLEAGRVFAETDGPETQPVVILNRTFVRKFFGDVNPVGRSLGRLDGPDFLVVGVVGDTLLSSAGQLNEGSAPVVSEEAMYVPATQILDGGLLSRLHTNYQPSWVVRTAPGAQITIQMQDALSAVDSALTFSGFSAMRDLMRDTLATQRVQVVLLGIMAGLALALSAIGLFALVANIVAQRRFELAIRMALGATLGKTLIHVASSGAWAAAIGGVIGLVVANGTLQALRSILYGVNVHDPATLVGVMLCLLTVALVATVTPALRVSRIDPAQVMREE